MAVISKIRRQGGALVMTIPPTLIKLLDLNAGAQMELDVTGGKLTARPVSPARKHYSLTELLKGSKSVARLNADTAWAREGEPVDRELA
ncbi:MAG: PbsX family transcriptional regulator [Candidimonas sp.]|nr:MAG: PbsX family transcriptional regulator [Burkholderiales bacterium 21-58-4]TAL90186.1 MAG: PbsX family transcriptional regulator [Candidimonas sp.]TAM27184.1 MAG: PbsX family transcriptional regulator [Candidimonas sp.]TAM74837.1 MAG: PbsX family transcriptional regulator [Candidimonas sp.]